ncbi:hypothetical protein LY76DRAFT_355374 [Colletotrichum caudatum]|nr:hypothetical protein LY76DRAFT_355374 [Colletotrichum caudatum]
MPVSFCVCLGMGNAVSPDGSHAMMQLSAALQHFNLSLSLRFFRLQHYRDHVISQGSHGPHKHANASIHALFPSKPRDALQIDASREAKSRRKTGRPCSCYEGPKGFPASAIDRPTN